MSALSSGSLGYHVISASIMLRETLSQLCFDVTAAPPTQRLLDECQWLLGQELSRRNGQRRLRLVLLVGVGTILLAIAYVIGEQTGTNDLHAAGAAAIGGALLGLVAQSVIDDAELASVTGIVIAAGASVMMSVGGPVWLWIALVAAAFPVVLGGDLARLTADGARAADEPLHASLSALQPIALEHCVATVDVCRQHALLARYQAQVAAQGRCLVEGEYFAMQAWTAREMSSSATRQQELMHEAVRAQQRAAFSMLREPLPQPDPNERAEA